MGYQNSFLFRESLRDIGETPTSDSIYWSPDIICHSQVANPNAFFTGNYDKDVNEDVKLGTAFNFLYARVKNISASNTLTVGYVSVYRTDSSLFMQPSLWRDNPLVTAKGKNRIELQSSTPGEIVTGNDVFLLSGLKNRNFCMMGIVSDSPTPTLPESDFRSYDDFIYWFRSNQAVCARNLSRCPSTERHYEELYFVQNPENTEKELFVRVAAPINVPEGTTYGIHCAPLGVQKEQKTKSGEQNVFVEIVSLPPKFEGHLVSYGSLPSGYSEWPTLEKVEVSIFVQMEPHHKSFRFGAPAEYFGVRRPATRGIVPFHKLVQLGCCSIVFVNEK